MRLVVVAAAHAPCVGIVAGPWKVHVMDLTPQGLDHAEIEREVNAYLSTLPAECEASVEFISLGAAIVTYRC